MNKIYYILILALTFSSATAQKLQDSLFIKQDSLPTSSSLLSSVFTDEPLKVPQPLILMPTPQTRIFEQYLNHSIDESNGLPDISIPLYEIELKGLKIPVVLSYHASGIKFDQNDGEVGAGWSINVGGYRVSRTVFGRPDDKYPFFKTSDFDYYSYSRGPMQNTYMAALGASYEDAQKIVTAQLGAHMINYGIQDSEYDQFNYMLPSTGGHFIITDRNISKCKIVEGHPDKIIMERDAYNDITGMTIIDGSGFTYHLGGGSVFREFQTPEGFWCNTAWALRKIITPYNQIVDFSYTQYSSINAANRSFIPPYLLIKDKATDLPLRASNRPTSEPEYITEEIDQSSQTFYVSKIESDQEIVEFERAGTGNENYIVRSITVKNKKGQVIRKITFNYESKNANLWHLLLKEIVIGDDIHSEKKYQFSYNLPDRNTTFDHLYPDQWGYYSGIRHVITLSQYKGLAIHQEYKNDLILTQSGMSTATRTIGDKFGNELDYLWFDRSVNKGFFNLFSLKSIKFPTGGITRYEYESHRHEVSGSIITGGGQRIKKISSTSGPGGIPIITEFKYGMNNNGIGHANMALNDRFWVREFRFFYPYPGMESDEATANCYIQPLRMYYPKSPYPEVNNFVVMYNSVTTCQYDSINSKNNGRTVSSYQLPENYITEAFPGTSSDESYHSIPFNHDRPYFVTYRPGRKSVLKQREIYTNDRLSQKESFQYHLTPDETVYTGAKVVHKNIFEPHVWETPDGLLCPDHWISDLFDFHYYSLYLGSNHLLASKTTVLYDEDGKGITTVENHYYNINNQPSYSTRTNSKNEMVKREFQYANDVSGTVYTSMLGKNMLSQVVQASDWINGSEILRLKTNYTDDLSITHGLILPVTIDTKDKSQAAAETRLRYHSYDNYGNPTCMSYENGPKVSYQWGYNHQYLTIKAENATYTDNTNTIRPNYYYEGFEDRTPILTTYKPFAGLNYNQGSYQVPFEKLEPNKKYIIEYRVYINGKWEQKSQEYTNNMTLSATAIDELRVYPADALMTTYTYKPLVGMTSETDPSGRTIFYEYDDFGRLKCVKDEDGNIVKEHSYHYAL